MALQHWHISGQSTFWIYSTRRIVCIHCNHHSSCGYPSSVCVICFYSTRSHVLGFYWENGDSGTGDWLVVFCCFYSYFNRQKMVRKREVVTPGFNDFVDEYAW